MLNTSPVEIAVEKAGGTSKALADLLGVTRQAVDRWRKEQRLPLDRVVEISQKTGIAKKRLAPGVFTR